MLIYLKSWVSKMFSFILAIGRREVPSKLKAQVWLELGYDFKADWFQEGDEQRYLKKLNDSQEPK